VLIDGYDFSGDHNALALDFGVDAVEDTNFGDTTHIFLGGLELTEATLEGAADHGNATVEGRHFGNVGVADTLMTLGPEGADDGEIAYVLKALSASYSPGASIGELLRFTVRANMSGDRLIRGTVMHNATRTSSGNGTARQLGAVSATQKVYVALHVIATVSGTSPTLDVIVQSDNASGMSSPTSRVTMTQKTALGSEMKSTAGAITDDWWRVNYTIGGSSTPTFPFIVTVGIR